MLSFALRDWFVQAPPDREDLAADLARAAGRLGFSELSEDLIALRRRFSDSATRNNIAWALGECGGPNAVAELTELIREPPQPLDESEFSQVARSLRRCGALGREALRGGLATARAGGGERDRVRRAAELAGLTGTSTG